MELNSLPFHCLIFTLHLLVNSLSNVMSTRIYGRGCFHALSSSHFPSESKNIKGKVRKTSGHKAGASLKFHELILRMGFYVLNSISVNFTKSSIHHHLSTFHSTLVFFKSKQTNNKVFKILEAHHSITHQISSITPATGFMSTKQNLSIT